MIVTLAQLVEWNACLPARKLFHEEFGEAADTTKVAAETAAKFDLDWLARYVFVGDQFIQYLDEKEYPLDALENAYERNRRARRNGEVSHTEYLKKRSAANDTFRLARAEIFLKIANQEKTTRYDDEEPAFQNGALQP